jgi:hypothetical protein
MEQTKALNALEPFLALSKSATSPRAAADLISQATSAPNTYVFAELLQTPNIQKLRQSPDHAAHLVLLEIFAWGTWEDYKGECCCSVDIHPLTLLQRKQTCPSSLHSSIRSFCFSLSCPSLDPMRVSPTPL